MKDELSGKIIVKLVGLRAKTYIYLLDGGSKDKKAKGTKDCVIKRKFKYKNCLEATQIENKIKYLEKKLTQMDRQIDRQIDRQTDFNIVLFFLNKKKHKEFKNSSKPINQY